MKYETSVETDSELVLNEHDGVEPRFTRTAVSWLLMVSLHALRVVHIYGDNYFGERNNSLHHRRSTNAKQHGTDNYPQ